MRSKSAAPATRRAIPSRTPELAPRPRITVSSCASSETANISPIAVPIAAMSRAIGGGSADGSGIGGGLVPQMHRGVLRGVRPVVGRGGRPAPRPSASALHQAARTSRRCPRRRSAQDRGDAHVPRVDGRLPARHGASARTPRCLRRHRARRAPSTRLGPPRAVRRSPRDAPPERGCGRRRPAGRGPMPQSVSSIAVRMERRSTSGSSSAQWFEMSNPSSSRYPTKSR